MTFRCLLLAILIPFLSRGQEVTVTGTASGLEGKYIELLRYTDPVSSEEIRLSADSIDSSGQFDLKTETAETQQVWIRINRFTAPLYIEPGAKYQLEVALSEKAAPLLAQWRPGELEYVFVDLSPSDINAKILAFDDAYFSFFQENVRLLGTRSLRPKVQEFQSLYAKLDDGFHKEYVEYSIAEMKLSSGFAKKDLYETYLEKRPLAFQNPAFFSFFTSFYTGSFDQIEIEKNNSSEERELTSELSLSALDSTLIASSDFLQYEEIRQWVLLQQINKSLYANQPSQELLELLKELERNTKSEQLINASRRIRLDFEKFSDPQLLEIIPEMENQIDKEKPALIIVTYPESLERMREKGVIAGLLEEYENYFQVVEIFLGQEVEEDASWVQIKTSSETGLMSDLGIYKLPWYGWATSELKLSKDIEKPSEGLEKRLYAIRAKKLEENKIKVGQ